MPSDDRIWYILMKAEIHILSAFHARSPYVRQVCRCTTLRLHCRWLCVFRHARFFIVVSSVSCHNRTHSDTRVSGIEWANGIERVQRTKRWKTTEKNKRAIQRNRRRKRNWIWFSVNRYLMSKGEMQTNMKLLQKSGRATVITFRLMFGPFDAAKSFLRIESSLGVFFPVHPRFN